jgi:hypothetical protein
VGRVLRSWWVFGVGVALFASLWLAMPGGSPNWDLVAYRNTVEDMRSGSSYYDAMNSGMVSAGVGPVSELRAFREPAAFLLWRYTSYSWPETLAAVVLIGVLIGFTSFPAAGLVAVVWLCLVLHPRGIDQWGYVETWALPFMIGAVLAIRRDRWTLAACLVLAACLIRELAFPMLIGGLIAAFVYRKPSAPWLAAGGAFLAFLGWHSAKVHPFLVEHGKQAALTGQGGAWAMVQMAGPLTYGLAFVVVALVVWRQRLSAAWWLAAPVLVLIPLAGLITYRPYWGIVVLPVALALVKLDGTPPRSDNAGMDRRPSTALASLRPPSSRDKDLVSSGAPLARWLVVDAASSYRPFR